MANNSNNRLGGQQPPAWDPMDADGSRPSRFDRSPGAFWQRFRRASPRQRVGIAAGAGGLLVVVLVGVALLCSHMPAIGSGALGASDSSTATAAASATAKATATTPAFALAFTCASGAVKQTARVCVHTIPSATLTITVRYCDGSYAGGKDLHGSYTPDRSGNFIWIFAVHTRCAGTATATVTAKSAGKTVTQSKKFTITQ